MAGTPRLAPRQEQDRAACGLSGSWRGRSWNWSPATCSLLYPCWPSPLSRGRRRARQPARRPRRLPRVGPTDYAPGEHSRASHMHRPRLDHQPHTSGRDRIEAGALPDTTTARRRSDHAFTLSYQRTECSTCDTRRYAR